MNKSTSRGWFLIFIHAITKDSPMSNFGVIKGRHIDEIKWKGDNPYVNYLDIKNINKAATPLPLTSNLIWISNSNTEDYPDNINFKMFMKWITTKFIPLAARNYPSV